MKKLIQNIKMAGLMAMALIAWPTTITAQSAKYDAKTVNAVTECFVAYAKINSQGTDTSDMDAFPLNPGQREMARKVEADLQAILRGTSATVTRSESEYVYVKIPANAKGIPSVMFMAHLDVTPEAPGGNITPVVHRGYDGGDLHLPSDWCSVRQRHRADTSPSAWARQSSPPTAAQSSELTTRQDAPSS